MEKVALFLRVSSSGQTTDNQSVELIDLCEKRDWMIVETYKEVVSGTKKNEDRAELSRMLEDLKKRRFTKVVVYDLSRLGRSVQQVVRTLSRLDEHDISLFSWKQNLDTADGGMSKMFFYFVSIFSEMEKSIQSSRQMTAINRMRSLGMKYGGKDFITDEQKDKIIQLKESGLSYRKIKEQVDVSLYSIGKVINEAA